jgi:hypothetical protein
MSAVNGKIKFKKQVTLQDPVHPGKAKSQVSTVNYVSCDREQ